MGAGRGQAIGILAWGSRRQTHSTACRCARDWRRSPGGLTLRARRSYSFKHWLQPTLWPRFLFTARHFRLSALRRLIDTVCWGFLKLWWRISILDSFVVWLQLRFPRNNINSVEKAICMTSFSPFHIYAKVHGLAVYPCLGSRMTRLLYQLQIKCTTESVWCNLLRFLKLWRRISMLGSLIEILFYENYGWTEKRSMYVLYITTYVGLALHILSGRATFSPYALTGYETLSFWGQAGRSIVRVLLLHLNLLCMGYRIEGPRRTVSDHWIKKRDYLLGI